jgi:branched-chain amino acid transport system ATP-binding protein
MRVLGGIILEIKGVTKKFKGLTALKDVSFNIHRNEIVGLIGPNGSGKTTLFNVISGIFHPDEGSVVLQGENISSEIPHVICQKGIGRTFQIAKPFINLTVLDNVIIGALNHSKNINTAREQAKRILRMVELEDMASMLGRDLPVLFRKRLELARALATGPEFLMLDEVMAGLNPIEIMNMISFLKEIAETGLTMLVVEHIMHAIINISDRVVVIQGGQLVAEGPPHEVMKNPKVLDAYLGEEYLLA